MIYPYGLWDTTTVLRITGDTAFPKLEPHQQYTLKIYQYINYGFDDGFVEVLREVVIATPEIKLPVLD